MKCEYPCAEHVGEVYTVRITGNGTIALFDLCQTARDVERAAGLSVDAVEPSEESTCSR